MGVPVGVGLSCGELSLLYAWKWRPSVPLERLLMAEAFSFLERLCSCRPFSVARLRLPPNEVAGLFGYSLEDFLKF